MNVAHDSMRCRAARRFIAAGVSPRSSDWPPSRRSACGGPRSAAVAVAFWPASIVMIGRQYALRGEFKRDAQAFALREGRAGEPEQPL